MSHTPLMSQYRDIKSRYDNCILFFRVGDFYETFYEDAVDVSKILNIALTTRDRKKPNPVPLAGVPFHAAETYINRLLAAGRRVAVCDQVEDASSAKGLVRREVVEVLTPGTSMSAQLLDARENNYCAAILIDDHLAGVAVIDVSTGQFMVGSADEVGAPHLAQGNRVRELICPSELDRNSISELCVAMGNPHITDMPQSLFEEPSVNSALHTQFADKTGGIVPNLSPLERRVAGGLLSHCQSLRGGALPQVIAVEPLAPPAFLAIDEETIRNLELFEPLYGGDSRATLIRVIDHTVTPMGGREIRNWLQKPLRDIRTIDERLDAVSELYHDTSLHELMLTALKGVNDMQRIAARIVARKAIPREFHALRESLSRLPPLKEALERCEAPLLQTIGTTIDAHVSLVDTLGRAIVEDPPGHLRAGGVIRKGFLDELDALIDRHEEAKRWIAGLERRERERTGVGTLKVGYNKVFGYYIEVSRSHRGSIPADYVAKQTLVNAERFYTEELKGKEQVILESEEQRVACEQAAYEKLCGIVEAVMGSLQTTSRAVGQIDVLQSNATTARKNRFRRPTVDNTKDIELSASRHPVVERLVKEAFVSNDLKLDPERRQFALITGPNMSGKSTFLRQVAVIVVLAQMGSFVPADRARIGMVDSIFTRVGAGDRLSRGESTFLVEMKETAHILDKMTDRSLVLLDEVGRGTSTYDGLSIAWAVTEYLLSGVKARPKTLFATHFHELTQLSSVYPRLVNLKITIREWEGGVIFLRKIAAGTSDRSYGIHAARVAGLPPQVLKRAEEILVSLELRRDLLRQGVSLDSKQRSLFDVTRDDGPASRGPGNDLKARITSFDIDARSPLEALQFLKALQDDIKSRM